MATLLAKTYATPVIIEHRSTASGEKYTVKSAEYLDTVTVKGAQLTCTCGQSTCAHIQVVQRQRARNAEADARRAYYSEMFDLSYGDFA